ncbi:alpha/beta-hydrolase N-terminal domain-containing protein [Arthrobacter alpinus]|nr:alpha/beta-hydrolase N-terminal domain-containing protein [Arthrobacter alpinus]
MNHTKSARIAGLIAAVAAVGLALTPSLVPRPALFQGFLAGLSFGLAYLAASWLWRTVAAFIARRRQTSPGARPPAAVSAAASASDTAASVMSTPTGTVAAASGRSTPPLWVWSAAGALAGIYVAVVGILAVHWQNDVRAKVEMAPVDGLELGTFFVVALLVGAMVFGVHRGLRTMAALGRHWTQRLLQKSSSSESLRASLRPASRLRIVTAGGLLTGTLTVVLALTLLVSGALLGTDRVYSARNDTTPAGITEPASEFRSAGSQSAVEWEKLGMQGRAFVGGGPTAATIEALTRLRPRNRCVSM